MMAKIIGFSKDSILKKYGAKIGDTITAFDGFSYADYLDYIFFDAKSKFEICLDRKNLQEKSTDLTVQNIKLQITKRGHQSMGAVLDCQTVQPVSCHNKCIFCFIDQMKKGQRDTLFVKDDDYRLSFISGNYITLTNLSRFDIERIKRIKLSPLFVSVHAFDPKVRCQMMGNYNAGNCFEILRELTNAGISFHTQIVLVEGVNDGEVLEQTLAELGKLYPKVESVAVVPVGLTKHREGLTKIQPLSLECIENTLSRVEAYNDKNKLSAWCSDEFYLRAGKDLPSYSYYEDFPQIENGVGLVAKFLKDFYDGFESAEEFGAHFDGQGVNEQEVCMQIARKQEAGKQEVCKQEVGKQDINKQNTKLHLVTGTSFYPILSNLMKNIQIQNLSFRVQEIKNNFFGETVTVAGLLTGQDIVEQIKFDNDTSAVIIPRVMLKEFEDIFLDDMTITELQTKLDKKIIIAPNDGYEFAEMLGEVIKNFCIKNF